MKTVTVTQALSTLRLMDKKIDKKIEGLNFYVIESATNVTVAGARVKDVASASKTIKDTYAAVRNLMDTRARLKGALVASNAVTSVTIGERTMTVAEAIEYKSSISAELEIQGRLNRAIAQAARFESQQETDLRQKIERQVASVMGNKKGIDANDETYQVIEKQIRKSESAKVHDVLDATVLTETLGDKIQDFISNVDVALTISNSTTTIAY